MRFQSFRIIGCAGAAVLLALGVAHAASGDSRLERNAPSMASSPVQLWQFAKFEDGFIDGQTVYLDVTTKGGKRAYWNPVSGAIVSYDRLDRSKLDRMRLIPVYEDLPLPNGGSIEAHIESIGARCGYTVGVYYTYDDGLGDAFDDFYIITKYPQPKETGYCGTPLRQQFDANIGDSVAALPDGRLFIVDWMSRLAFAFAHVPKSIISLDDKLFIVPASFLKPALDAAGDDQAARYKALLHALKNHPHTVIHPKLVE